MTGEHISFALPLRIRLFLEGVEVPVIAANIQTSPNSPSIATIQMPPLAEGTRLMPRTTVHLFFLDMYAASNPFVTETNLDTASAQSPASPTAKEKGQNPRGVTITPHPCGHRESRDEDNIRYKLLFAGEMIGFGWMKTPTQRSLTLQCMDMSNYWDYAYQFGNTGIFGPGYKAVFSGGATNLFTDFLSSKGSVITSIVSRGRCNSFPKLRGLAAGIIRLIEAVGGSYYARPSKDGKASRKLAGQNIFFSTAELRLHITQMIAAYENDPTSKRILTRQGYSGMFNRAIGGQGAQVSIRKAINALSKVMFHETYAQPCPRYIPGKDNQVGGTRRVRIADSEWSRVTSYALQASLGITMMQQSLANLESEMDVISGALGSRNFRKAVAVVRKQMRDTRKLLNQWQLELRGAPPPSRTIFSTAGQAVRFAEIWLRRWTPKGPQSYKQKVDKYLNEALAQLQRAQDLTVNTTPLKEREPARLAQQIFRPDIWFGAAPRCNVLFPEAYEQFNYKRIYVKEPTRFLLKTNDEFFGEDFLFDRLYFAPQAGALRKDQANLKTMLRNELLDHELFTGILPVFEKMGEFNIFASRSWGTKGPVPKVSLAQRSCNFLYFKHRFNARTASLVGKFNPYVACGFPGVIIDKWADMEAANQLRAIRLQYESTTGQVMPPSYSRGILGTNYLGNFSTVVHQLSHQQRLGKTTINLTYTRQPEESVEFLGTSERAQTVQKREDLDARRSEDVAAIAKPPVHSLGPQGGKIVAVKDVTAEYRRGAAGEIPGIDHENAGRKLQVFFSGVRHKGGKPPDVQVPIATATTAKEQASTELEEFIGDPNKTVVFNAYRLTEDIPRYRREVIDMPAEELIRPGWYGDVWSPGKIGAVYNDFFATGAITDPQYILDSGGAPLGSQSEASQQAAAEGERVEGSQEDPKANIPAVTALEEGATIEQAVEFLTLTYSYVKQAGLDVDEFIRAYTWRPIATMLDMFGTADLEFNQRGEEALQGTEGFHSRAFGPYENLFGLASPEIEDIIGVKRGDAAAQRADTRKRKLDAVLTYSSALSGSRAHLS